MMDTRRRPYTYMGESPCGPYADAAIEHMHSDRRSAGVPARRLRLKRAMAKYAPSLRTATAPPAGGSPEHLSAETWTSWRHWAASNDTYMQAIRTPQMAHASGPAHHGSPSAKPIVQHWQGCPGDGEGVKVDPRGVQVDRDWGCPGGPRDRGVHIGRFPLIPNSPIEQPHLTDKYETARGRLTQKKSEGQNGGQRPHPPLPPPPHRWARSANSGARLARCCGRR
jgi:hypothetical protein